MSQNNIQRGLFLVSSTFVLFAFQNCTSRLSSGLSAVTNASLRVDQNFSLISKNFASGNSSRCALDRLAGTGQDVSVELQACLDRSAAGDTLAIPAGRFTVLNQVKISHSVLLMTEGRADSEACAGDDNHGCAEFIAAPEAAMTSGILAVTGDSITLDHIVINGNKEARQNSVAGNNCRNNHNEYGYNAVFTGSNITLTNNVFKNALCATGAYLSGTNFQVQGNKILNNGVHNVAGLWADGMTIAEMRDSNVSHNLYQDNTDIDLIFGACANCQIQNNQVIHSDVFQTSSFAGIMIQAWPNGSTSGNYTGADISQNSVNCSAGQRCGFGMYLGNSAWYDAAVYGGNVHDNVVLGAQQGYAIDKVTGFSFANNNVDGSGGVFLTSCGSKQLTAFVVTPGTQVDRSQDLIPSYHYAQFSLDGCVPNWWTQDPRPPAPIAAPAPNATDLVVVLYRGLLQREPDAGGLQFWLGIAAQTQDGAQLARGVALSDEAAHRRAGISVEQMVTDLYGGLLGRPPESGDVVAAWSGYLRSVGYAMTLEGFINSDEYRARCSGMGLQVPPVVPTLPTREYN